MPQRRANRGKDHHGPAIPIGQLIGHTYQDVMDADIVSVRCPRCELTIDADDWEDHRDKECPALWENAKQGR